MKSLDYPRYKDATEADVLMELLKSESIIDYDEIEWSILQPRLFYLEPVGTGRSTHLEMFLTIDKFVGEIIPRQEVVRILTYLRENADKLFNEEEFDSSCIKVFEDECARLIHQNLKDSIRDEYHGDYCHWPRPNLRQIAMGQKFSYKMSPEDKIIANHLPSYPHYTGAFPIEMVIKVAHDFVEGFMSQVSEYERTQESRNKPAMSVKSYIDSIKCELMQLANRYMYYDEQPAYQVLWVVSILMRLPHMSNWWRDAFAGNIITYLNCTKYFSNTKDKMDAAIAEIRALTEQELPFDNMPAATQNTTSSPPVKVALNKDIVKNLEEILAKPRMVTHCDGTPLIKIFAEKVDIGTNTAPITSIDNNYGDIYQ
ncbi:MAG TPA: hypothetical protein DCG33_02045 [Prevotellaceae bacterium]|nr:hypothetical protein [Prevotellaceae bacterium]